MGSDNRSMGCGIVEYATSDDARNAIATLHRTELKVVFCQCGKIGMM